MLQVIIKFLFGKFISRMHVLGMSDQPVPKGGVPAVPIAEGNFDRAWNDPPLFR